MKRWKVEAHPSGDALAWWRLLDGQGRVVASFADPAVARALLAVARAADYDVSAEHHAIAKKGEGLRCRLCYALARLEKASHK